MRRTLSWIIITYAFGTPVLAAPPPGSDMSLAPWYQDLKVPNNGTNTANLPCCGIGDCRPVRYRIADNHYEAFIDKKTFNNDKAPDAWVSVPDEVIIKNKENPVGEGVLCFYSGTVRCFIPASGA